MTPQQKNVAWAILATLAGALTLMLVFRPEVRWDQDERALVIDIFSTAPVGYVIEFSGQGVKLEREFRKLAPTRRRPF